MNECVQEMKRVDPGLQRNLILKGIHSVMYAADIDQYIFSGFQ